MECEEKLGFTNIKINNRFWQWHWMDTKLLGLVSSIYLLFCLDWAFYYLNVAWFRKVLSRSRPIMIFQHQKSRYRLIGQFFLFFFICNNANYNNTEWTLVFVFNFYPFFSPISRYPIVFSSSYYLVSSLQLPYWLGRNEGWKSCVLWYTPQPSCTAS